MQTLVALLLFASLSIHAEEKGFIENTLDRLRAFTGTIKNCKNCDSTRNPEQEPDWKVCLSQMCPRLPNSVDIGLETIKSDFHKHPDSAGAAKAVTQALLENLRELDEANKYVLQGLKENARIDQPTAQIMGLFMKMSNEYSGMVTLDAQGKLDMNKTRESFIAQGGTKDSFEPYEKILALGIATIEEEETKRAADFDYDGLKLLKPDQVKAKLKGFTNELRELGKKLSAQSSLSPEFVISSRLLANYEREIEEGKLSSRHLENIKDQLQGGLIYVKLMAPNFIKNFKSQSKLLKDVMNVEDFRKINSEAEQIERIIRDPENPGEGTLAKRFQEVQSSCMAALGYAFALSPTKKDLEEFPARERKLRALYVDRLKGVVSGESGKVLAEVIPKWKLKLPPSREEAISDFIDELKEANNGPAMADLVKDSRPQTGQTAIMLQISRASLDDPEKYFEDFEDTCRGGIPSMHTSHATLGGDKVFFGGLKILRKEFSQSNGFHEYSHLLSGVISGNPKVSSHTKAWFKNVRECWNEQRHGKAQHEEEDWAETLSNYLAPEAVSYVCDSHPFDSKAAIKLSDDKFDKDHSGSFYHDVLRMQIQKGELTKECKGALAEAGETNIPENCFKKFPRAEAK